MSILRLFGLGGAPEETPVSRSAAVQHIVAGLARLEPERARYIATFAFVLGRVARADLRVNQAERELMQAILAEHAELDEEEAALAVEIVEVQGALIGGTEDFVVTREFNDLADREQKLALLDCLFAVAAADHVISGDEEREMRKVADELRLTRRDYMAVRMRYRDHLSIFRPTED